MLRKYYKELIVLLLIAAVITAAVFGIDIKSVDEYYSMPLDEITDTSKVVYMSIDCKTIFDNIEQLDKNLSAYLPPDGIILPKKPYALKAGDTAFDLLLRVTRYNRISVEYDGNNAFGSKYVEGIANFYEFSCGKLSGWTILVNGKLLTNSSDKYSLKANDVVEWRYTCDNGRDVEAENE